MRCKIGDLAVIIRDDEFPQNVGGFVEIIERATLEKFHAPLVDDWSCQPLQDLWGRETLSGRVSCDKDPVGFPDDWLRPIRPSGQDSTFRTETRELETI